MISNHALKKVRLSLSTWQLLLVSTRWQINLSPENKLLKQHNLGQFGCSSLVKKFGRNCLTYLINYQDSTKVWEIPQTLCVVGMTTYYGINFKNSKSVKIFQDMHWCHESRKRHLRRPYFSKGLTKLAILQDYKRHGMWKLGFQSEFSMSKIIWISLNFLFHWKMIS